MKWDLKRPCKHCPFSKHERAIRFACRERAEEIEEIAYRQGFVCHEHSTYYENEDGEGHYDFGPDGAQHCVGALLMYLVSGGSNVPYENLSETEQERIVDRLDWSSPHFESEDEFLDLHGPPEDD